MKHLLGSITLLLLSTLAFGQVPNTFSSGETISSSKINANFAYLAQAIKSDNISAIMICKTSGYKSSDNTFYFGDCFSSDSQTFETIPTLVKSYFQSYNQRYEQKYVDNVPRCISLSDVFNGKWVLYQSNEGLSSSSRQSNNTEYFVFVNETHIFYKVSSD